jgi:hypothetical protein
VSENAPDPTPEANDGPQGVFGNLPASRPGSRSPRRRGAKDEAAGKPDLSKAEAEPADAGPDTNEAAEQAEPTAPVQSGADPAGQEEGPGPRHSPPSAPAQGIHGVEDLAWAGVAVAAQVATAGIRFTSRALEAARKSIDRP